MNDKIYRKIISESISLGMMLHLRILTPDADRITRNRAVRYLSQAGIPNARLYLNRLISSGRLPIRKADAKNARITLSATQLHTIVIEQLISDMENDIQLYAEKQKQLSTM